MPASSTSVDDILLIPSAVQVPDQLYLDVGSIPTGLIPLRGKPMLEHIAEAYIDHDVTRIVIAGESAESIYEHASRSKFNWNIIEISNTSSVGETIHRGLDSIGVDNRSGRKLYVNFSDTLVSPLRTINSKNIISYRERNRTYRWTTFEIEDEHIVNPKKKNQSVREGSQPCFAGQFGLLDADDFYQLLQETPYQDKDGLDPFYVSLLSYLESSDYELYQPESWIDVGHLDTYHRAKKYFLNSREFNELESSGKNTITKRSDDTETLINEITWYNNIPVELQPYLPRIYDYATSAENPYVKLEYIGYPSLSDLQLYSAHPQHIWDDVFYRIFDMHHEFQSFNADANDRKIRRSLEEIYLNKTQRRLSRLRDDERFQPFFSKERILINGCSYPPISTILRELKSTLSEYGLLSRDDLSIIHGDLCFPNILYDPRTEIVKVIDPRGEFGEYSIYGDPRYDLAKLRHSAVGHYEHMINDRFSVSSDLSIPEIDYEVYTTEDQVKRESRFDSILSIKTPTDVETIKLIEGLLFLSMVPLHSDSYERQRCMLAKGIEKFSQFI